MILEPPLSAIKACPAFALIFPLINALSPYKFIPRVFPRPVTPFSISILPKISPFFERINVCEGEGVGGTPGIFPPPLRVIS